MSHHRLTATAVAAAAAMLLILSWFAVRPPATPDGTNTNTTTEGFVLPPSFAPPLPTDRRWPPDLVRRFLAFQKTVNQNVRQYNLDELQRQATAAEAETLLRTGMWPWTDEVRRLYLARVARHPIIRQSLPDALKEARQTYCQRAAVELLAWNTHEGKLLMDTCATAPDGTAQMSEATQAGLAAHSRCNVCAALDAPEAARGCPVRVKGRQGTSPAWRLFANNSAM